jgi:predicted tellurium resistance membrane protein TerC
VDYVGARLHTAFISEWSEPALRFFTGYLIEKSLSVDNILSVLIFRLSVSAAIQHRVLFWASGVADAELIRSARCCPMSFIDHLCLARLILTGIRMAFRDTPSTPEENRWSGWYAVHCR